MNFLQIVTKLANLADIPYSSITDVETLTGELALVVDWAKTACFDIQNKHNGHWKFLHSEYTRQLRESKNLDVTSASDNGGGLVALTITNHSFSANDYVRIHGTTNYDGTYKADATTSANDLVIPATYVAEIFDGTEQAQVRDYEFYTAAGIKDFDRESFYYYLKTDGANGSSRLRFLEYNVFKRRYLDYEDLDSPQVVTITPDKKLRIYPAPDDVYVIGCDSFLKPVELIANDDVPPFDEEHHDLVVWKGLIDFGGFEESGSIFKHASLRFDEMYKELEWQQLQEDEQKVAVPM